MIFISKQGKGEQKGLLCLLLHCIEDTAEKKSSTVLKKERMNEPLEPQPNIEVFLFLSNKAVLAIIQSIFFFFCGTDTEI